VPRSGPHGAMLANTSVLPCPFSVNAMPLLHTFASTGSSCHLLYRSHPSSYRLAMMRVEGRCVQVLVFPHETPLIRCTAQHRVNLRSVSVRPVFRHEAALGQIPLLALGQMSQVCRPMRKGYSSCPMLQPTTCCS
jgi:hypothetical protein